MKKFASLCILIISFITSFAQGVLTPTIVDSISMRDGKKLAVDIYIPDGGGGLQYSSILVQTPYNRQAYRIIGLPLVGNDVAGSPFVYVIADWRGFYGSLSAAVAGYDRGKDGYDLVEWIALQPWSNTKIGTWGPSALGKIQFETAKKKPPHLVCCVPLVAGSQFNYSEYYPGGVYRTEYIEQLDALGFGLSLVVKPYPTYDNVWKYIIEPPNYYPDSINVPMFMIGGWYDHNTEVILQMFDGLCNHSYPGVRNLHRLMFGPWVHGGIGPAQVGSAQQGELFYYEAMGWSDSLALAFLSYYLDSIPNGWDSQPLVKYFQMGENNWYSANTWPPTDVSSYNLYMHSGGWLYPEMPYFAGDFGIITYNPRNPSPTIGGATLRQDLEQGPFDQSPIVESRTDILKFTSIILGQNVVMKGKASVHLFVSCNHKDTDYAIRLTDVYPDGRSMLLTEGIRRLRFRDGYQPTDTAVAIPGNIYEVVIELPDIANTFLGGHRIRVDVTSSNYPRFDCNLNNGLAMNTAGDTLTATSYIYLNPNYASYIQLPLVDFVGGINNYSEKAELFKIYPNPSVINDILFIEADMDNNSKIEIIDISGRIAGVIYGNQHTGKSSIIEYSLQKFNPGIYILKYSGQKGISEQKLVIF